MKKWFYILLFVAIYSNGQNMDPYYNAHISNIVPSSPEAFKFTQYGGVPVNEASGVANVNIPLGEYTIGRINVPIILNYRSEGVKVDEMNGWAGMTWQLAAGGMITRVVNDRADDQYMENPTISHQYRKFYTYDQLLSFVPTGPFYNGEDLYNINIGDGEVDIFSFRFGNYNGSFFLDENFVPQLINRDQELKIELTGPLHNNLAFCITTPDGLKYFFGGSGKSETTMMRTGVGAWTDPSQTTLYLAKIADINGDEVYFDYVGGSSRKLIGYNQTFEKVYNTKNWDYNDFTCEQMIELVYYERLANLSASEILLDAQGSNAVSLITNNRTNDKIVFNNTNNTNTQILRNIIDQIDFVNYSNTIFKKVKFEYTDSSARKFLTKLSFLGEGEATTNNHYKFEYDNPQLLAPRFSMGQDHWGYYNGRLNANFIPRVDDAVLQIGFPFADRDAYFNYASKGVLKKIIYPTKGFSDFEYESGTEVWPLEYTKVNRTLSVNYNTPANTNIKMNHQVNTLADPNSSTGSSILNTSQSVMVEINATVKGPLSNLHKLRFTLDDLNSTTDFTGIIELENIYNPNIPMKSFNKLFTFSNLNTQGNYVLRLEYYKEDMLDPYPAYPNYMIASASVTFSTYTPLSKDKLGLRVKTIKDYSATGVIADYKRYYYNTYANRNNTTDSQTFMKLPEYVSNEIHEYPCYVNPEAGVWGCTTAFRQAKVISSNALNSIYFPIGNRYKYVTVSYGGENFEGGGKELTFSVEGDTDLVTVLNPIAVSIYNHLDFSKTSNTGRHNGELLDEKYFKIASGAFSLVQQKTYSYTDIPSKSGYITNCFNTKIFLRNSCHRDPGVPIDDYTDSYSPNGAYPMVPMDFNIRNIYFGAYNTYYDSHVLNKVVTTNYYGGSPVVITDEMFYDSMIAGLPTRKQTTGTNGLKSTKYYYPQDLSTDAFMQELITSNRYELIRTESFDNNVKISESKTMYAKDATTSNIVLPKYEYMAKFPNSLPNLAGVGQLEKRFTYNQYDLKGNILQYTPEGGTSTSIIWGYNRTLPLAKVENATFSQITSALGTTEASLQALTTPPSNLRAVLPSAMVTTFTHKPSVGIISVTDAKGYIMYYNYDQSGRLLNVRDANNYILSENEYYFKP
jgi:YD repeat-containing protein